MDQNEQSSGLFTPGPTLQDAPSGDSARQAVDSLRGYVYQIAATALAWLDLNDTGRVYLEVAEDYAVVAHDALSAVQVKDTSASGSVTLNTIGVREAIASYVDLVARNPNRTVRLHYLTTSPIGKEKKRADRPGGESGLIYWRKAAAGAEVGPLRAVLEGEAMPKIVRSFVSSRDDETLRCELLRNVHWDCGRPGLPKLRQELVERLIVLGRDRYGVPSDEARRLADIVMHCVLVKSVLKEATERYLTRAELDTVIDDATRVTLPRADLDELLRKIASSSSLGAKGSASTGAEISVSEHASWLVIGADLPLPSQMIPRPALEAKICTALTTYGVACLVGGTGVGKSLLARAVSRKRAGKFVIVDLRDLEKEEVRQRLAKVLGYIGGPESPVMILEDLNHIDDPGVLLALGRIVAALRRRDCYGLVTSYRTPSVRALVELDLGSSACFEVPNFTEDEAGEVVQIAGGDPSVWGRIAHLAGGFGHPQLVHAFARGMAVRQWPEKAIGEVFARGLSSDEIDEARNSARFSLIAALPKGARTLLSRTSLVIGRFDRALALLIGELAPAIPSAGEHFDQLIGPWIEADVGGSYKVSPLASNTGRDILSPTVQQSVHDLIANQIFAERTIDASDANGIFTHAMLGKSEGPLTALTNAVVTADQEAHELLADHFFLLRIVRTDKPIYPDNPYLSCILRLAQFRLVSAKSEGTAIAECANALLAEIAQLTHGHLRSMLEGFALSTVLLVRGIANHIPNWIDLLSRFIEVVEANSELSKFKDNFESSARSKSVNFYGILFAAGASGISSIARFEEILDMLDGVGTENRDIFLRDFEQQPSDYSVFVDGPWLAEHTRGNIDWADAAARYERVARRAKTWGVRELALRCHVARAVMLDEYGEDHDAALRAIDEGVDALGEDIVLSLARTKILWRHSDHDEVVSILHDIEGQIGRDEPISRAFAFREGAISAAKTNDWNQAEIWFEEAASAARSSPSDNMKPMEIGLEIDTAIASYKSGQRMRTLERLSAVLEALRTLDPESSLKAAYCHRIARHAVLWLRSEIEGSAKYIDDQPIAMLPGACSNPDPVAAIKELPLGHLDIAWYLLAEAEVTVDEDAGIATALPSKLAGGPIPNLEVLLRKSWMDASLRRVDSSLFAKHLKNWIEAMSYVQDKESEDFISFDTLAPSRGKIPKMSSAELAAEVSNTVAIHSILAFCVSAVLRNEAQLLASLDINLRSEFGHSFPGCVVFDHWRGKATSLDQLDDAVANVVKLLREERHIDPYNVWGAGLRMFEWINQSDFKQQLTPILAEWLRARWSKTIADERFRLTNPTTTVPAVEAALETTGNDRSFVAGLLLAGCAAVGSRLAPTYRAQLEKMVSDENSTS